VTNQMDRSRNRINDDFSTLIVIVITSCLLLSFGNESFGQERGGRDGSSSRPVTKGNSTKASKPASPSKPKLANATFILNPADSVLVIDEQTSVSVDAFGIARLNGLKPGVHSIAVQRSGYREKQQLVDLNVGDNAPVTIKLDALMGTINISPGVTDSEISLKSIDRNQSVGTYSGTIAEVQFLPGEYEVIVSKKGYQSVIRRFILKPDESVYLEPQLDPVPVERPRIGITGSTQIEGKFLIVNLRGTSGDKSQRSGTIAVSVNKSNPQVVYLTGNFTGFPCEIEVVHLENVSASSLIEVPGNLNDWSRVSVRVRPKDSKKTIHFAIRWRLL
jgi:hypothetical protein